MPRSSAPTVAAYLAGLTPERRAALSAVRTVIKRNLPRGYQEAMGFGMITYHVPLRRYPDTYNGQPLCLAALASQKNFATLYLMTVYGDPGLLKRLQDGFKNAGKRLDMGKSCIHFQKPDDLALDVIGAIVATVPVDKYVAIAAAAKRGRPTRKRNPK
jgi:hypothetical protein